MEDTKSIDRADMVLGLFLDNMTMNFPNRVVIDDQVEENLKNGNKQKVDADILPFLPQEQCLLPHQRHAQSDQKLKHKKISQENNDQERIRPRYDPILVSYTHLLPILVNIRALMPKQIEPAKFPYHRKHDPHATCGYHAGYVGHSTEAYHVLKTKVQELINRNLLLPTKSKLFKRNVIFGSHNLVCPVCFTYDETVNHPFASYPFAVEERCF
ncbi:hypothetical protein KIW84_033931 [Lathyrus oleraceus]|uniref:Uncharacterized protein n=1 Tax=Pisum sativum TaxID=3888 RepID=A0A9D4XY70_PEA|nr:hypothetical protein KIW84_033931 [Pisum sativum]